MKVVTKRKQNDLESGDREQPQSLVNDLCTISAELSFFLLRHVFVVLYAQHVLSTGLENDIMDLRGCFCLARD